ncbi:MAG TPA: helix-turn-helix domain-containing protein [Burkholderiaceae bacterium]|nr:helix-turn-helix domain-containing protein [Burkholderiaceae bacterium]
MTQTETILAALRAGPLTPLEALDRFGCFRLAARVRDLREQGHHIAVERVELPSGKHVARYRLAEETTA